jgi:hypothetical protein
MAAMASKNQVFCGWDMQASFAKKLWRQSALQRSLGDAATGSGD